MNYKMLIQYDGSRFYGWEHQPGQEMTIQGKLESVLSLMVDAPVEVIGAGRTDAGVHARGMVANAKFETDKSVEEIRDYMNHAGVHAKAMIANVRLNTEKTCEEIREYMNHYLPDDICILEVRIAADAFHSRYKAKGKTYQYTCYLGDTKPVFDRKYVFVLEEKPDPEAMKRAAGYLLGTHDFASFCGNARMKKSTVRMVHRIDIEQQGERLTFTYHGSGFLQYMVRILTGTLLEVGFGKRDPDSMPKLIEARDRRLAGFTAPAKGLCLLKVDY